MKGAHTLYAGWRLLISEDQAEEKSDEKSQMTLPNLEEKQILISIKSEVLALKTQAPKPYSEPALIAKLEKERRGLVGPQRMPLSYEPFRIENIYNLGVSYLK